MPLTELVDLTQLVDLSGLSNIRNNGLLSEMNGANLG